jgi:hypothetical protein
MESSHSWTRIAKESESIYIYIYICHNFNAKDFFVRVWFESASRKTKGKRPKGQKCSNHVQFKLMSYIDDHPNHACVLIY